MADVAKTADALLEALKREGMKDNGKLRIAEGEDERALFRLLDFLAKKVCVYSTGHDFIVKRAPHIF